MNIKKFVFNPFQENTYVVWDDDLLCAIIDPGCSDQNERNEIETFITKTKLKPIKLLNTHCHIDHVLGNKFVSETYGVGLEIHINEIPVLNAVPNYGASFGFNTGEMLKPLNFLKEGTKINVGSIIFDILFVPGHSPGSICFYNTDSNNIISGDALFYGSIGRTDLPGGNHKQLIESIKTQLLTLPESTTVLSGHGPSTTIGFEKANNSFLH